MFNKLYLNIGLLSFGCFAMEPGQERPAARVVQGPQQVPQGGRVVVPPYIVEPLQEPYRVVRVVLPTKLSEDIAGLLKRQSTPKESK